MVKVAIIFLFIVYYATAQNQLPESINIVSGVPLTLPSNMLKFMGLTPEQNKGGWGDVMSNVAMALDIKTQFPEIKVRLIVTLNDDDKREYVNRVREFIPKVLLDENNQPYLNPDLKTPQDYKGIEVYFVSVPQVLSFSSPDNLSSDQIQSLKSIVKHVPFADMGLQYSANDKAFSNLVVKSKNMHIYFCEYSASIKSHAFVFFQNESISMKINAGPLSFGVYGFGSQDNTIHSQENKQIVNAWLDKIKNENNALKKMNLSLGNIELSFAYAGDVQMIEDYNKAIEQIAKQDKTKFTVIAYKGQGKVRIIANRVYIPLNEHPKELANALISESTYSPLVTGDVSLSAAIKTTSENKTFLYENVQWKESAMTALIKEIFSDHPISNMATNELLIPQTWALHRMKMNRKKRITQITEAILNHKVHKEIHFYFSQRQKSLNIADNTINLYQFSTIYKSLKASFKRKIFFSESYLDFLVDFTKEFEAKDFIPKWKLYEILQNQDHFEVNQLFEKWYSLYTLWELGYDVKVDDVIRTINHTKILVSQIIDDVNNTSEFQLSGILEQINGSEKSKIGLLKTVSSNQQAQDSFDLILKWYNSGATKKFRMPKQNRCFSFYKTPVIHAPLGNVN